jgi:8-oxo-dGTP pyrophosphatase MutT (NUDIX family)
VADDEVEPATPAATVVLLRDSSAGLETLMLRRNSRLAFAGGAWVFPGGRIDPEDFANGTPDTDDDVLLAAARNAAVRETMEEAHLAIDVDTLVWFAHWTPATGAPHRFATWFFVTRAPEGAVTVDEGEIHEHRWIRPTDAIRRRDLGEVELVPPTWVTLFTLAELSTVADAISYFDARDPEYYVSRIFPVEGGMAAFWAGDVAYDDGDLTKPGPRNRLLMLPDGWRYDRTR